MLITSGQVNMVLGPLRSNDGTAGYFGSTAAAVDALRGTQANFIWPEVMASPTNYVTITFQINPAPSAGKPPKLFAILNISPEIRDGTVMELLGGNDNNPTNVIATTTVQTLPDGQRGTWLYVPAQSNTFAWWGWKIYNNDGDGAYIPGETQSKIGELFADSVDVYCATAISSELVDPTRINRSSYNLARPLMRKPFRRLTVSFIPTDYEDAFIATDSLQALTYRMAQASYCAIVPREAENRLTAPDPEYVQQTAILARVTNIGSIGSDARTDRWPLSLSFEELL